MWLRDLLPSCVSHARIATYSYESDWRKADVKTSLRKCGEQLLNVLYQCRSSEKVSSVILDIYPILLRISAGVSTTADLCRAQSWWIDHQTGRYGLDSGQLFLH